MRTFKVISDNFSLGKQGSTVNETELDGLDLVMLVEAGHLEPIAGKQSKTQTQEEGE